MRIGVSNRDTPRSGAILIFLLAALFGASACRRSDATPVSGRPNFVFVLTDDQQWDDIPCGHRDMAAGSAA